MYVFKSFQGAINVRRKGYSFDRDVIRTIIGTIRGLSGTSLLKL